MEHQNRRYPLKNVIQTFFVLIAVFIPMLSDAAIQNKNTNGGRAIVNAVPVRHASGSRGIVNAIAVRHASGSRGIVNAIPVRHANGGRALVNAIPVRHANGGRAIVNAIPVRHANGSIDHKQTQLPLRQKRVLTKKNSGPRKLLDLNA